MEIVSKILQEEQLINKKQRTQALLLKPSTTDRLPSLTRASEKLLYYLDPIPPSATEERDTIVRGI